MKLGGRLGDTITSLTDVNRNESQSVAFKVSLTAIRRVWDSSVKIFVTGGAGFIGSHYVRTVLSGGFPAFEGALVTVLDRLTYAGNLANLAPVEGRFTFVEGDVCDARLLAEVVPGHDLVLHFAAESHVDRSIDGAAD